MSQAAEVAAADSPHKRWVMVYTRYERFWHWSQAALIALLLFTGFAVHGSHGLIGFEKAVKVHTIAAIVLILLWVFTIFWHATTGQWHHYAPRSGVVEMIKYYAWGIISSQPRPFHKSLARKQNPLQTLAYLWFVLFVGPLLWASGLLYLTHPLWAKALSGTLGLGTVALAHTAGAFLMAIFVVVHIYIATTGKTPGAYIKTMIIGYDELPLDAVEEKYLETHHGNIK